VDGGIHVETAPLVVEAGANALVSGSGVFSDARYAENIKAIRDAAKRGRIAA
jgi:ribulose-phosphate 3-epimerase